MRSISRHTTPLVINSLGCGHTHTHASILTICTGSILRNQAHTSLRRRTLGLKSDSYIYIMCDGMSSNSVNTGEIGKISVEILFCVILLSSNQATRNVFWSQKSETMVYAYKTFILSHIEYLLTLHTCCTL